MAHLRLCRTCNKTYLTAFKHSTMCDKCKDLKGLGRRIKLSKKETKLYDSFWNKNGN